MLTICQAAKTTDQNRRTVTKLSSVNHNAFVHKMRRATDPMVLGHLPILDLWKGSGNDEEDDGMVKKERERKTEMRGRTKHIFGTPIGSGAL